MQTYSSSEEGETQKAACGEYSNNSYTRSWHSFKLNSFKFLVQVKLVQAFSRSWARKATPVHTRSWESRSWMRYAALVCRGIVYSYKTPFTKHCFISSIRSHTKFWLDPIIFYSSGCPKKGESHLPGKKIEIDSLELQLKRRRGEAGKHNLLGEIGGIKCTYHILECFLKTSVVKIPKESSFLEYNHWYRCVGISG